MRTAAALLGTVRRTEQFWTLTGQGFIGNAVCCKVLHTCLVFIAYKILPSSVVRQIAFSKVNDTCLDQETVTGYSGIHYFFFLISSW
jgi:hypothetical protein